VLSDHGLVEVDTSSQEWIESRGYSIYKCVHSWTIHVLNQGWDHDLARVAVKFVGSHVPGEKAVRPWLTQQRLPQHAARCSYIVLNSLVIDDGMVWAYHNMGSLYADQGRLGEAETIYQRALQGKEKALDAEHTSTLDTVHNLGVLYRNQGRLGEAETMFRRALQGYEKAFRAEHTSTLDTVNSLGNLYQHRGNLGEAETMYQRALQGYEKVLGADNTTTFILSLNTIRGLGSLFERQGDLSKARIMYSKALVGYEKVIGPDHLRSRGLRDKLCALDTMT
jgi:tetratricopeptide (TPR) repeat protein